MSKTSKLPVLTLAETPHFSRHCHLVPAGQSVSEADGTDPFVSHPATPSVPARPLGSVCPDPAIPSTEHPNPTGRWTRGARSPRWGTPRSRWALCNRHPKAGSHPSFFTYPGRAGAWRLTREPTAFRNAETLLQIPTILDAAMFLKQAH